ncbi:meiotic recombination protein W68, partial [Glossina fuscipes]|uniref:DNA topoisomerase (ATP-hydrolyzing) n=1 Tax=Glossina fuscipes TaxID=7396 RepID=A0A9C5Z2B4_9MUSC
VDLELVLRNDLIFTNSEIQIISYRCAASRERFTLFICILAEIHNLLLAHSYCTYRELFYRNSELADSQSKIQRAVNDLCYVLNTTFWNLGVFASSKGLMAGSLLIYMSNGDVINYKAPSFVPTNFTYIDRLQTTASYILLVEKDTVFEKMLSTRIFSLIHENIILVTGRGYPDIASRWILQRLHTEHRLAIYMLADADPCGIEIMLIYRHGSLTQAANALQLTCPHLKWLGIHPSDLKHLRIPTEPLVLNDCRKIEFLLRREYVDNGVRQELNILKYFCRKAKLDNMSINKFQMFVCDYIINKIKRQIVI